jgi:hypothetical protein
MIPISSIDQLVELLKQTDRKIYMTPVDHPEDFRSISRPTTMGCTLSTIADMLRNNQFYYQVIAAPKVTTPIGAISLPRLKLKDEKENIR